MDYIIIKDIIPLSIDIKNLKIEYHSFPDKYGEDISIEDICNIVSKLKLDYIKKACYSLILSYHSDKISSL